MSPAVRARPGRRAVALLGLGFIRNAHAGTAAPHDLFVSPTGAGTACTRAAPCTLATALSLATDGDTLYLAGGTYTGTGAAVITLTRSITLAGGWDGAVTGPLNIDPERYPTVLDGERRRRVVYVSPNITVTLDGLVLPVATRLAYTWICVLASGANQTAVVVACWQPPGPGSSCAAASSPTTWPR